MPDTPFVRMRGIDKSFGAVRALDDVDLAIAPGEELQVFGPFDTHAKADDVWRDKSFAMVDNAMARFTVRSQHELEEIEHKILKQKKKDQKKAQGKD